MIVTVDARHRHDNQGNHDDWADLYATEEWDDVHQAMDDYVENRVNTEGSEALTVAERTVHGSMGLILFESGYEVRFWEEDEEDYMDYDYDEEE